MGQVQIQQHQQQQEEKLLQTVVNFLQTPVASLSASAKEFVPSSALFTQQEQEQEEPIVMASGASLTDNAAETPEFTKSQVSSIMEEIANKCAATAAEMYMPKIETLCATVKSLQAELFSMQAAVDLTSTVLPESTVNECG